MFVLLPIEERFRHERSSLSRSRIAIISITLSAHLDVGLKILEGISETYDSYTYKYMHSYVYGCRMISTGSDS